jgi:type I restriction enzyme S subunit
MSSEGTTLPLEELCEAVIDCPHSTPVWMDYGVVVLRSSNIRNGRLDLSNPSFTDENHYDERSKRARIQAGDLVITREAPMGEVCLIPDNLRCCLGQRMVMLRPDSSKCHGKYLLYALQSKRVQNQIKSHEGTGSTVSNLRIPVLKELAIPSPSIEKQKAIAHILGTLDDKIELNRKTNETLEAMAKALFKSWFVDFDPVRAKAEGRPTGLPAEISDLFPDSFEDSVLGEIPRGWQCCSFTKLVDVISGGTPKTSIDGYWNGSIPWFSVVDAPPGSSCWVIQTEKRITPEGLANCSSKLLPTGTTIISARGTVGKVCLAGRDMAMNQSCYGLRSKAENGEFFCFCLTKSLVEILEARAHGSVFSTITRDTLDGVATISPSLEAIQSFNRSTGALLGKIKTNLEENRILGNQRDALLPKLISGELRIPDAEKMLKEVGV